jgi:hypothetical protein
MKAFFTLFILLSLFNSHAQSISPYILNVTGNSAVSGYYRFDWSVGELCLIETYTKPTGTVENGLLHAGTERPGSAAANNFFANGDIMIFPNPVYTTTEVDFVVQQPGKVSMNLIDVLGRQILTRQFDYNGIGRIEKLDMQLFPAGTYFLYVLLTPTDNTMPSRKGTFKLVHVTN